MKINHGFEIKHLCEFGPKWVLRGPGAYCIKLLTGENSGYFLPEFFPVLKSMAESC